MLWGSEKLQVYLCMVFFPAGVCSSNSHDAVFSINFSFVFLGFFFLDFPIVGFCSLTTDGWLPHFSMTLPFESSVDE